MTPTYNPKIFDQPSIESAASIILTPDGWTPEQRWGKETPFLTRLIGERFRPTSNSVILDYGCGIGRLAKPLIETYGCSVIGVDATPSMLQYAVDYVRSPKFIPRSPEELRALPLQADFALAIWVLQHCPFLDTDIETICRNLKPAGELFCLNTTRRVVPAVDEQRGEFWADDGIDVQAVLARKMKLASHHDLATEAFSPESRETAWIATFINERV